MKAFEFNRFIISIGVVGLLTLAILAGQVRADPPLAGELESTDGFTSMTDITVATTSARLVGTLPSGKRSFIAYAVSANVNYGGSDVSTGTSELYIPIGESRWFGYFWKTAPTVYFRIRGTSTDTTTLELRAGPKVLKPN